MIVPNIWRRGFWSLLAVSLLVLFGGCRTKTISGLVVDSQGNPIPGIIVELCGGKDEKTLLRPPIGRSETGVDGRFAIQADFDSAELAVLKGESGIGRIKVPKEGGSDIRLTYPVKTTIVFLHDNDLHFNFNHLDRFTAEIGRIRNAYENVFLVNAGDLFIRKPEYWNEPTKEFYAHHANKMIDMMNRLEYDAATLGNHDLNYIDSLTRNALEKAKFPLLGANIEISTDQLPKLLPYVIFTTDTDISIFVLGLSLVNFKQEGVLGRNPVETTRKYLDLAKKHDVFVALTHIDVRKDRELANAIGDIDVIIGGHSHTLLNEAEVVNGVLIAQAGGTAAQSASVDPNRPKYLGIVTIELENDQIVEKRGIVISFTSDQ